ncbi:GH1 family beta-glucosidase [Psychromarinibacter sp. S121]|uniref:GH1 family beta-glucosidase n=1 Tax=Psychromarinibacter sp. S121 TaxID=3415127 RepID=UPI003C7D8286
MRHTRADFPKDFIFGAATSSYQIEGHGQGGAGRTQWDDFAATPGNVVRAENGARACDHYNRFEEDLDLAAGMGLDAYRFSTSWARVLPEGTGTPNPEGLDFYDRLVDAMLARGLKPFPTLYHWELPSPLVDKGGWRNRDIAEWFGEFTEVIMGRIGDRVHAAAPINEPWCVAWLSHFMGAHAPGVRDIRAAARAMHHVLLGHGRAIEVMRGLGMKNLGAVTNHEYVLPADESDEAAAAARMYDGIYNRWFLSGIYSGTYPPDVLDMLEAHMPKGWEDDMKSISQPVDWAGINYYTRKLVSPGDTGLPGDLHEGVGDLPQTTMGWEIYPEGLYGMLTRVGQAYARNIPIYVTENGMSASDVIQNGEVHDQHRIDYLNIHMDAVQKAISEGIDVRGYFIWSLLDNYEWALGYEKRFGLIHVDFDTLERTPKQSYHALKTALKR